VSFLSRRKKVKRKREKREKKVRNKGVFGGNFENGAVGDR